MPTKTIVSFVSYGSFFLKPLASFPALVKDELMYRRLWQFLVMVALSGPMFGPKLQAQSAPSEHFAQRPQNWTRRDKPVLSAYTTRQSWSKVVIYSPHVIHHDGKFRMWYLGTSTASRSRALTAHPGDTTPSFRSSSPGPGSSRARSIARSTRSMWPQRFPPLPAPSHPPGLAARSSSRS